MRTKTERNYETTPKRLCSNFAEELRDYWLEEDEEEYFQFELDTLNGRWEGEGIFFQLGKSGLLVVGWHNDYGEIACPRFGDDIAHIADVFLHTRLQLANYQNFDYKRKLRKWRLQ